MRHKLKLAVEKLYKIKSFFYRPAFFVFFLTLTIFLFVFAIEADSKINNAASKVLTLKFSRLITFQQENFTQSTEQFLIALSQTSEIKNYRSSSSRCDNILAKILDKNSLFLNFGVLDIEGNLACSVIESNQLINASDRSYFREVVQNKGFGVGDYQIGRVTGKPSINFGYPIFDDANNLSGILFAALDLAWFDRMIKYEPPPAGMSTLIFDRNSTVVYSYPQSELVGKSIADFEIYRRALINKSGVLDAIDPDGVKKIYSYAPLDSKNEGLFVAVGSEKHSILQTAISVITPRTSWLTVITVIIVFLIWADIYFLVYFIRKIKGK